MSEAASLLSPAEILAAMPEGERVQVLGALADGDAADLIRSWQFWARPSQRAPGWLWRWWVVVTGRGWGKNRASSEWVCDRAEQFAAAPNPPSEKGWPHLVGLMNATFTEVRQLQLGGESGLDAVAERRGHVLDIGGSSSLEGELRVRAPQLASGWHVTTIEVHTADNPDRVRGRNFHSIAADEVSKWRHKVDEQGGTAFTNADFGLRAVCPSGMVPQGLVTMTPKPIPIVKDLLAGRYGKTAVTRGALYENLANLAPSFIEAVLARYHGTRLGGQEILGRLLDQVEGALWSEGLIELRRVTAVPVAHRLRKCVGVDPPGETAECGIVVCGANQPTQDDRETFSPGRLSLGQHLYVLDDASMAGPAEAWAAQVVATFHRWDAGVVVAEVNNGYDMVRAVIHNVDPTVPVVKAYASKGKRTRAEPVAMLWDQGRGHLVGYFGELESQMVTWVPGDDSPDRMDALVWAATFLVVGLKSVESGTVIHDDRLGGRR